MPSRLLLLRLVYLAFERSKKLSVCGWLVVVVVVVCLAVVWAGS